jgi:pyruvate formate lyase activating enzyme
MLIGGLQRCSFIDYPGKLAAVVFTQGCNFRCAYCHNPGLVTRRFTKSVPEVELFDLLARRRGKLAGVVITGGEPTLQGDLVDLVGRIRERGFLVKLDTNGTDPDTLARLFDLGLLDYVAMDVKSDLATYDAVAGTTVDHAAIQRSIAAIIGSGVDHEFRTTVAVPPHDADILHHLAAMVRGGRRLYLQAMREDEMLDRNHGYAPPAADWLAAIARDIGVTVLPCFVR